MRALVATGDADMPLEFGDVEEPVRGPSEVVIAVDYISVNRGEYHRLRTAPQGWRPGWDVTGRVVEAPGSPDGPAVGDRVVGLVGGGGWAELVAVDTANVAVVPEAVEMRDAVTLPVAGVTALRCLGRAGQLMGKQVLITGAAGGVGNLAVHLALGSGAQVTATATGRHRATVIDYGDAEVVESLEDVYRQEYDVIIESIGGESLARALGSVARGGTIVTLGNSSNERTTFVANDFYTRNGATLSAYFLFDDIAHDPVRDDLATLVRLVESTRLCPRVGIEAAWDDATEVLHMLAARQVNGKAVLKVG